MRKIFSIARYTFIGNFRNRIFLVLVLFGLMLLGASVLLGLLSQEQELRMLTDLGLAAIETLSFLTAIFLMGNLVLEEMESKTIYLILTRSVSRGEYLLGRFLGTMVSVLSCYVIMTAAHLALLLAKGWSPEKEGFLYFLSVFMSFEKIVLISALSLLFSLFSSSGVVSLVFTIFFWVLGHFSMELKFLAGEIHKGYLKAVFKFVYYIVPHFQYMNARDLWVTVADKMTFYLVEGSVYTAVYSAFSLVLALLIFRKKEF